MIGSLLVTNELIFTIHSVIQMISISSIKSIRLRFKLGKPRILVLFVGPLMSLFLLMETSDLDLKARVDPLTCEHCCLHTIHSSDSSLCVLSDSPLVASTRFEPRH